ncbi:small integral membrane protein 26 [Ambystoma mexicanum]|uniref:small integral membrane protein 26 n=1 Tax=Ambystoma mexicanum TaxID=8296 RepID=UPI0037E8E9F5
MATPAEVLRWKKRMSIVYAAGVWTVVSCFGYRYLKGRWWPQTSESPADCEELPTVFETKLEPKHEPFFTQEMVYKENFVPYTTRLYMFVKSILGKEN